MTSDFHRSLATTLALATLFALTCAGCAGETQFAYDTRSGVVTVTHRSGEVVTMVPEQRLAEAKAEAAKEPTRAELVVAVGKLAGDAGLGAELVGIAEENGQRRARDAHESALRLVDWLHGRLPRSSRRGLSSGPPPRGNPENDVENRARRAWGEDLDR